MQDQNSDALLNMFPDFSHIVERICTSNWRIEKGKYMKHNVVLVYDGEAVFCCNGESFKAGRGDLIYFRSGDVRWAYTNPKNLMKCFAVDFLYTCPQLIDNRWVLTEMPLPLSFHQKINDPYLLMRLLDLFKDLTGAWLSGKPNKVIRCRVVFMEMISILLLWKNAQGVNYDKIRKVEKVIYYMTEHYSQKIRLEELCALIHVGSSYLLEIFKEVTGKSPISYLIYMRIEKAKELLKDGYTVVQAANQTGFSDELYFSKCFKKLEGINPSEYKKLF